MVWLEGVHLLGWICVAELACAVVEDLIQRGLDSREAVVRGGAVFLFWERLRPCHGLFLLDLEIVIPVGWPLRSVLIKFVVVFVDLVNQNLHFTAGVVVFLLVLGAYAQVQRVLALFFLWSFLEAGTMASKSQLDDLVLVDAGVEACSAFLDDPLHVRSFGADHSSGDLELSFVGDLNFIFASIFHSLVFLALIWIIVRRCVRSRLVRWTLSTWLKLVDILVWDERLWLLRRHKWNWLWLVADLCLLLLLVHGQRLIPSVEWLGRRLEMWSTHSKLTLRI